MPPPFSSSQGERPFHDDSYCSDNRYTQLGWRRRAGLIPAFPIRREQIPPYIRHLSLVGLRRGPIHATPQFSLSQGESPFHVDSYSYSYSMVQPSNGLH
jgi:hypothetical protein